MFTASRDFLARRELESAVVRHACQSLANVKDRRVSRFSGRPHDWRQETSFERSCEGVKRETQTLAVCRVRVRKPCDGRAQARHAQSVPGRRLLACEGGIRWR
eukprot:1999670-Pleurochrysis_carterae.AAC.1